MDAGGPCSSCWAARTSHFPRWLAAFPWLRDLPPRALSQLQTEVRYDGYLPRQQADIRAFQREETVALSGVAFDQVGGLSAELTAKLAQLQPGFARRRIPDPGHDAGRVGGDRGPCEEAWLASGSGLSRPFHVEHGLTPNDVSRETRAALEKYSALLLRWNRTVNLVAPGDEPQLWERHIANSLQLAPLICQPIDRAIDLGSGAGFPGLILALATGIPFDLVEADQRKAAFLREAARITGAPVRVHAVRIESADLPPAPLITARALAPLPKLLDLAAPLLAPGGQCLFLKGISAQTELTHAAAQWHMRVERIPSRTAPDACILRITDLRRVVPRS